jgi:hypothetical protein
LAVQLARSGGSRAVSMSTFWKRYRIVGIKPLIAAIADLADHGF